MFCVLCFVFWVGSVLEKKTSQLPSQFDRYLEGFAFPRSLTMIRCALVVENFVIFRDRDGHAETRKITKFSNFFDACENACARLIELPSPI